MSLKLIRAGGSHVCRGMHRMLANCAEEEDGLFTGYWPCKVISMFSQKGLGVPLGSQTKSFGCIFMRLPTSQLCLVKCDSHQRSTLGESLTRFGGW